MLGAEPEQSQKELESKDRAEHDNPLLFQAQTATLTIAQAFNLAFDRWKQGTFTAALD